MWEWRCWISASSGYVACYSGVRLQSIIKCSRGCNSYVFRAKEEGTTCWIGIIARKYTIVEGKLGDGAVDRKGIKLFLKERGEKLYKILQVQLSSSMMSFSRGIFWHESCFWGLSILMIWSSLQGSFLILTPLNIAWSVIANYTINAHYPFFYEMETRTLQYLAPYNLWFSLK